MNTELKAAEDTSLRERPRTGGILVSRVQFSIVAASAVFCALGVGRFAWLNFGPQSWGPRLACAEPSFDCGEVPAGEAIQHEFVIANTGRKPLQILMAAPGCGACLTVETPNEQISPGGSGVVRVQMAADKVTEGEFSQRLFVWTDAANAPKVMLSLGGTGVAAPGVVRLEPHHPSQTVSVRGLDQAVDKIRVSGPISLSGLLHATHLFGFEMPVSVAGQPEPVPALDVILNHDLAVRYFGEAPLVSTRYGVRCHVTKRRNLHLQPGGVVHAYQFLALLALHQVPLDTPLTTAQGEGRVEDILADALANFSPAQDEVEWATMAFALYLSPQRSWQDKFGQAFSFNDLAQLLLETPLDGPGRACEGIHVLQALTILSAVDRGHPILSAQVRSTIRSRLREHAASIVRLQRPTGALEPLWHASPAVRREAAALLDDQQNLRRAVTITAHHLEWMLLLPVEMLPEDVFFAKAGRWLYEQLQAAPRARIEEQYCPYSHAAYMAQRLCSPSVGGVAQISSSDPL